MTLIKYICQIYSNNKLFHTNFTKLSPVNVKNRKLKGSSRSWIIRHLEDPYVKLASHKNYRARSAFKLLEVNEKFKILERGFSVLDCGAAPGSWSQVSLECVGKEGKVVAIDISYFDKIIGVHCLPFHDVYDKELKQKLINILQGTCSENTTKFDVILSDMAPNASGIKSMDHELISKLCLETYNLCFTLLKVGGSLVCKIWNGYRSKEIFDQMTTSFNFVKIYKPQASRDESAESFFVCKGFKF